MHLSALADIGQGINDPIVIGFRPFGGIAGDDLFPQVKDPAKHPLVDATTIDVDDYTFAMTRFRKRLVRDLIAGPSLSSPAFSDVQAVSVLLRLVARARDGDAQRLIVEQLESVSHDNFQTMLSNAPEWGRLSLLRLAP
ncbi:hypothetical protein C6558_23625 [Ensifer sp. NM-2]|nr:hypothetical protein C6558_23625 [Ensifer sp. NM-2]